MTVSQVDLLVTGGTVVTDSWSGPATVVIADGIVQALLDPSATPPPADRTIRADDRLVIPGGVDAHCHIGQPVGAYTTLDTFASATRAALAGGTTTIIDFAIPGVGQDARDALRERLDLATDARCDYAMHGCIRDPASDIEGVVDAFGESGVRTVKLFTTYRGLLMVDIPTVERVMTALQNLSGLTYVHAEDNELVENAQDDAERHGHIDASGHSLTRPPRAEEHAVAAVLGAADRVGAPVYFVHQSTPTAVDLVATSRRNGVRAYSESCPHYLTLDDSCYAAPHPERWVCCPPLRDAATVAALDARLETGFVHTVGSDHCCYDSGQKSEHANDVRQMPNGMPGIETRLPVIFDRFVATGRITPQRFVALTAANPARLNGLYPRKGTIAPGSDADLVVLDPAQSRVVSAGGLHMDTDYSPYEGRTVTGWPTMVVSAGRVVLDGDALTDPGPVGRFLPAGAIAD